jgi:hypothetical protein
VSQSHAGRPSLWTRHGRDALIILVLALLPALFLWRLVAPNPTDRMNVPAGDFTGQYYPLRFYAASELAAGRLSLWNPYAYAGQPALADIQSGALYPPQVAEALLLHWLGLGFPIWALELQVLFHLAWAAVGAYLLGQRLARRAGATPRLSRFAGVIVSLVFTYSGYLTGFPVQQLTILEVSAWAPWVLLAMDLLATAVVEVWRPRSGRWLLAGAVLGLSLLPGHPQTSLYVIYLAVAYYLFRVGVGFSSAPRSGSVPNFGRLCSRWTLVHRQTSFDRHVILRILYPRRVCVSTETLEGDRQIPVSPRMVGICRSLASKRRKFLSSQSAAQAKNPVFHPRQLSFARTRSFAPLRYAQDDRYRNLPDNVLAPRSAGADRPPATLYLLRAACYLLLALLFALALTAVQVLPTLELIAHSPRADLNYAAVSFGLPLQELVSVIYPGYFGGSPQYVGIFPLVLIGLALALGRPRSSVAFWAGAGLLALLLALGSNTFVYPLFYLLAPGFDAVRHQERAFLIYALSAAVLSGYGSLALVTALDRVRRARLARFERGLRVVFWAALGLTALFFYGWLGGEHRDLFTGVLRHHVFGLMMLAGGLILLALRPARRLRRSWGMALVAGWIAFNLFSVNWQFNLEPPGATGPFAATELTQFLKAHTAPAGAGPPQRIASAGLLPGGPGAASVYRLDDVTGNTPLHLATVEAFEAGVPEWRGWQLLNVHYVLSDRDLASPGLSLVFPSDPPAEGQVRVYAMGDPFPRAWVVHRVEVIADQGAALSRLGADDFDLRAAAVVAEPLPGSLSGSTGTATANVVAFSPGRIQVEVDTPDPGLLVLSEVAYPGWHASVDDQPTPVIPTDVLLRGVPVSAGHHIVRLWYAPLSARIGLLISLLALVVGLALGLTGVRPKF